MFAGARAREGEDAMPEILLIRPTEMELLAVILVLAGAALILLILLVRRRPAQVVSELRGPLAAIEGRFEQTEREFREELARSRQESAFGDRQMREEMQAGLGLLTESLLGRMAEIARLQKDQLDSFSRQLTDLTAMNEGKLEALRAAMENRLLALQASSAEKLDQMRHIVDEKLQSTLEKRLGESFKQVSERLEQVYTGLGEMRTLAAGVGDSRRC
jgi:DNA recombination protein RmuC